MKARNFSELIVLWNLISGEATPLDVVFLGEKKKNIPSEDWTHIRNKKKKKITEGMSKEHLKTFNIWTRPLLEPVNNPSGKLAIVNSSCVAKESRTSEGIFILREIEL